MHDPALHISGREPLGEEAFAWTGPQGGEQIGMRQIVEGPTNVYAYHPRPPRGRVGKAVDLLQGIMTTAARSESVAASLEPSLPKGFEGILDLGLEAAIKDSGNSEWTKLGVGFRDVHPTHGLGTPGVTRRESIHELSACLWSLHDQFIDPRRMSTCIELRHPPNTEQRVSVAAQHELLQAAGALVVARL
jgi:hypothetical protein